MSAFEPFESFGDIEDIARGLSSADASVRRLAVIEIAETASPEAVGYLASAVADAESDVRFQAVRALGEFDGPIVAMPW